MVDLPPPDSPATAALKAAQASSTPKLPSHPTEEEAAARPDLPEGHGFRNSFDSLEIAEQVHQCQEWITQGYRPNEIRRICAQRWGLCSRVVNERISLARRQIIADVNCLDRPGKVAQMVEQLEEVVKMSLATKQGSNAIGGIRLQADLLQLLNRYS